MKRMMRMMKRRRMKRMMRMMKRRRMMEDGKREETHTHTKE
jgi:hypothetical protein